MFTDHTDPTPSPTTTALPGSRRSVRRLVVAMVGTIAIGAAITGGQANADPRTNFVVGVGVDSTEDILNAMSGYANGIAYIPITSSNATGNAIIHSYDSTPPAGVADLCITPQLGGPTFTRPSGSTGGRRALSRSIDGGPWSGSPSGSFPICAANVDISGVLTFARSAVGPTGVGTDLTYIPFAQDAVSFAYYRPAGAPVTALSTAQLTSLFTTGPQVIGGVRIVPCGIDTGSTTFAFWLTAAGTTTTAEALATATCNGLPGGRLGQGDAAGLVARGDALAAQPATAGDQVVMAFSASNFIARSNLVAAGAIPVSVGIGSITNNGSGINLGPPTVGVAPNLRASASFFGDTRYGRPAYNVLATAIVQGPGNNDIRSLFVGSGSAVCGASLLRDLFGFIAVPNCGSTTLTGPLVS